MTEGKLNYSGKLTEILDEFPGGSIIRCHQAFAVNITNIREITRSEAVTLGGKRIPISRPYMKNIQSAFLMNMQEF